MKKITLIILTYFMFNYNASSQDHIFSLGTQEFTNISVNYERKISSDFNLKLDFSRSLKNGEKSKNSVTYDYSALSGKIFNGSIFDFDFFHGPGILVGTFYEYASFENEIDSDQNSSTVTPKYNIGLQYEVGDNILISTELSIGAHFLFNDFMSVLDKYDMGNFIPYIGFNIYVGYNYPNDILNFF